MTKQEDEERKPEPRSIAVTATAEELGIKLDVYDPVMDGVEGVEMPNPDDD